MWVHPVRLVLWLASEWTHLILETVAIGAALIVPASLWFADRIHKREHDSGSVARERAVLQQARKDAKVQLDKTTYAGERVIFADRLAKADKALIDFEQRVAKEAWVNSHGSRER